MTNEMLERSKQCMDAWTQNIKQVSYRLILPNPLHDIKYYESRRSTPHDDKADAITQRDQQLKQSKIYFCHLAILREEDGSFSVLVLNLPGCCSCGDSEDEAIENVREAVVGAVESYIEDGLAVPWQTLDEYTIPEGAKQKWILVHA